MEWRLFHLGVWGISLINLLFFALGFAIVARIYAVNTIEKFLWLTTPSLYFMFVPYSGEERVIWLSSLAVLVCSIALGAILIKFYKWLFNDKKYTDKILILTLAYLPIILFVMVFCNPKWGSLTTNLLGMHRYTFCTPFIFVFLYHYTSGIHNYKLKHFICIFILSNIV